jgi:DNA gyrase subunit B
MSIDAESDKTRTPAPSEYNATSIRLLEGIEAIRLRPGMYIGDTTFRGLHHLIYEVVDNSIDEAMAGHCTDIVVTLFPDGSVSILDNGRGIPVDIHAETGTTALEVVLTTPHAGGKFDHNTYKVSGGLHGVGVTVVNALSEWLEAEVQRGGQIWRQDYRQGLVQGAIRACGPTSKTGTMIRFLPDNTIFPIITFEYDILERRLRELAYLNPGVRITLIDERNEDRREEIFYSEEGLAGFVSWLNRSETVLHPPIRFVGRDDERGVEVEVSMQYNDSIRENVTSYCNNIHTHEGGTHLTGFRTALTRSLNVYIKDNPASSRVKDLEITGDDFREGLTAIVSVRVPDPQFEGQTKTKLGNGEVEGITARIVNEKLNQFIEENPAVARKIREKATLAAEARIAAKKARELVRNRKGVLSGVGLPGKLMDCTTHELDNSELFLVEGDSAGGTAEGGRDRQYQAILPLRGKILNVERARLDKVLGNDEVRNIITAVGCGIGDEEDPGKRRYGKIVMMSDADVDGSHIRTLLMTFFYRQMPRLVDGGHLYVAQPPLYMITQRKERKYVREEAEMQEILMANGLRDASLKVLEDGPTFSGDQLKALVDIMLILENGLRTFGRRNIPLAKLIAEADTQSPASHPQHGLLPLYMVHQGGLTRWVHDAVEAESISGSSSQSAASPDGAEEPASSTEAQENANQDEVRVIELHELRAVNRQLARLRAEYELFAAMLLPHEVTGDEPPPRFEYRKGEEVHLLDDLRGLAPLVRKLGERGLKITRFKGLGEMDADQLWDTTMDPTRRGLMQVRLEDVAAANDLFNTLMGDDVEPRREFIEKHALEVKNLDV